MKTVALLSGGKDSVMAVLMAMRHGHFPVVVANMEPGEGLHEVDSYMYQTVGHEVIEDFARCLQLPLRRSTVVRGQAKNQALLYTDAPSEDDEVEALYRLLKDIVAEFPGVRGVTSGAILSNYQRNRVECVCRRLGLVSLAYLWNQRAQDVLDMVETLRMRAIIVKTASIGLDPRVILGKTLSEARPSLEKVSSEYGTHMAGEGGEFESLVLDCPLYKTHRLHVRERELVMVDSNEYAPSAHLVLHVERVEKTEEEKRADAEVLCKLLNGEISFPSDRQVLFMRIVGEFIPKWRGVESAALAHALRPDGGIDMYWGKPSYQLSLTSSMDLTTSGEVKSAVHEVLVRIRTWLGGDKVLVHLIAYLPNLTEFEEAFREAYESVTSPIGPPCLTLLGISSEASEALSVEVLAAPRPTSDTQAACTDVLHSQSRSSWAAGCPGPYAQARRVAWPEDGSFRVMTSAAAGLVPETWELAVASDLVDAFSDDASVGAMTTLTKDFIAQFAHAVWNASRYGGIFGLSLRGCTHVSVYVCTAVTNEVDAGTLIPALWTCCSEEWTKVKGRILTVEALPRNAAVHILLEWRHEAST